MKHNLSALDEGREYDTAEPTVTMTQAQLDAAIAAAVRAETAVHSTIIHNMAEGYRFSGKDDLAEALEEAAAAIRARGNGSK